MPRTYTRKCECGTCPTCKNREKMARYRQTKGGVEASYRAHANWRKKQRAWLDEQRNVPCQTCGKRYPAPCMDFHHANEDKEFTIGTKAFRMSKDRLAVEIAKCDVLCANCHRLLHHEASPLRAPTEP